MVRLKFLLATLLGLLLPVAAADTPMRIAVASNFFIPLKQAVADYRRQNPEAAEITLSVGSTGKLFAQIRQGAPFDLFFAADEARPLRLHTEGLSIGANQPYTLGELVLWHPQNLNAVSLPERLHGVRRIAMPNPALAPYGLAAEQTLKYLGLSQELAAQVVKAENVGQSYAMVASGNAGVGFVALSQVQQNANATAAYTPIPASMHDPIAQHVVALKNGRLPGQAEDFLAFFLDKRPLEQR
jgi:molybdate transport system substrate-binding protein